MKTFNEYLSEETTYQPGDRVSWYYNKFHPRYPCRVVRRDGDHYVVKSEGNGEYYKIHKSAVNQYGKPD